MTIRHRNSNKHAPRATQVLPSSGDTPVFLASASTLVLLSSPLVVEDEEPKAFNLDEKSEDEKGVILTPHHFQWQRLKFPHRLFHLLNLMEREELSTLAHWNEKGTSFRVPKSKELVDNFLPYFFQQNKWKSFQRVSITAVPITTGASSFFLLLMISSLKSHHSSESLFPTTTTTTIRSN